MPRHRFIRVAAASAAFICSLSLAQTYPTVRPGSELVFPRDFGSHPEYRIEWWYLTGWLTAESGQAYGVQLTIFRLRPGAQEGYSASAFAAHQLLFAHAAVSDPRLGHLRHAEKSARAGFGLAFAELPDTRVAIDDWQIERRNGRYLARARGEGFAYELTATPRAALLLNGSNGFSQKAPDPTHASYYYSQPQLEVSGWIEVAGGRQNVSGTAWLDHEWSSDYLAGGAVGWDWVGANLNDGTAVMAFRTRDAAGRALWAGASVLRPGRDAQSFGPDAIRFTPRRRWRSPRTGADYPVETQVEVGELSLRLVPLIDDQELDTRRSVGAMYWEGAVRVLAADGRELGKGYLELTGYAERLRM